MNKAQEAYNQWDKEREKIPRIRTFGESFCEAWDRQDVRYKKVLDAAKKAFEPHPDDNHIYAISGKTVNQKLLEQAIEEFEGS